MAKGDHIKVRRRGLLYAHHGIDLGDGSVAHYCEHRKQKAMLHGGRVERTSLQDFLKGGTLRLVKHPQERTLPVDETCRRAMAAVGGPEDYHLIFNNCEHFASYCKTGKARSGQIRRAAGAAAGATAGALALGLMAVLKRRVF